MIQQYLNYLLGTILLIIVFGNIFKKPIKRWRSKRLAHQRKEAQLKQLNDNQKKLIAEIKKVAEFFNWIDDKIFINSKQKKQFYREFHQKKYRQEWFNRLLKQLESKAKATEVKIKGKDAIKKPKVEENKNGNK